VRHGMCEESGVQSDLLSTKDTVNGDTSTTPARAYESISDSLHTTCSNLASPRSLVLPGEGGQNGPAVTLRSTPSAPGVECWPDGCPPKC